MHTPKIGCIFAEEIRNNMNVKQLKDYLNSLDDRFDNLEILSTNNIRGCKNQKDCDSINIEVENTMLVDENGRVNLEKPISKKAKLIIY